MWEPQDREGQSLSHVFDLYAAPTDLLRAKRGYSGLLKFYDAVQKIAGLKNWHGHDGAHMPNDTAVWEAIRSGNHAELSKWFIPTIDILGFHGAGEQKVDGWTIPENVLYAYSVSGDFEKTFKDGMDRRDGINHDYASHWYWSCTERRVDRSAVWLTNFVYGYASYHRWDSCAATVRPVRAELRLVR